MEKTQDACARQACMSNKLLIFILLLLSLNIFFNIHFLCILTCIFSLLIGYFLTHLLHENSDCRFLLNLLEEPSDKPSSCIDDYLSDAGKCNGTDFVKCSPWEGIFIPKNLNQSLEEFLEQLIDNYINNWYKTKISSDAAFVDEIRYQIRYSIAVFYNKVKKLDFANILLHEALPHIIAHCEKVVKLTADIDKSIYPPQMVETKILEGMCDVHHALSSRQNEVDYLRHIAEQAIGHLMDDSRIGGRATDDDSPQIDFAFSCMRPWPSHICRHFIREILVFSILLPLLDLIANPDTINRILILLLDFDVLNYSSLTQEIEKVELLHGLCDYTPSESLLQLKLSDILRDIRQLQMLEMYMKDVNAPINELHFLIHISDAHERMLSAQGDESTISELRFDIWQMYSKYIHRGAPYTVKLPEFLVSEFVEAVECDDLASLDRSMEKTFQMLYKRVQNEYVTPFCQSEYYLGNLCGSPPVTVGELMADEIMLFTNNRLLPAVDSTFSLSQFRSRFWKMIMPTPAEVDPSNSKKRVENQSFDETNNDLIDDIDARLQHMAMSPTFEIVDENGSKNEDFANSQELISQVGSIPHRASNPCLLEASIFDPYRDLSKWMVNISSVEQRFDPIGGENVYVYVICVERLDLKCENQTESQILDELQPTKWTTIRRYNEFYTLESKLLEFHGSAITTESLPSRKPFSTKNMSYLESQRESFESFIQLLTKEPSLKHSDLLFAFLTSDLELKDSSQISDLNPWNVVKKMPSKFARERGQNLKPFILSVLASTLALQGQNVGNIDNSSKPSEHSESSSLSSYNSEGTLRPRCSLISDVFGNNCPTVRVSYSARPAEPWTRSFSDAMLHFLESICGLSGWRIWILVSLRNLFRKTFDTLAVSTLKKSLSAVLNEANCVCIVQFVQDFVFSDQSTIVPREQERLLRAELAQRLLLEYLSQNAPQHIINIIGHKELRHGVQTIFRILQYPRLNKQLSFVFLDMFVDKLYSKDYMNSKI